MTNQMSHSWLLDSSEARLRKAFVNWAGPSTLSSITCNVGEWTTSWLNRRRSTRPKTFTEEGLFLGNAQAILVCSIGKPTDELSLSGPGSMKETFGKYVCDSEENVLGCPKTRECSHVGHSG